MVDWGPVKYCPTCTLQLEDRWDSKDDSMWWYCKECDTIYSSADVKSSYATHTSITTEELVMKSDSNKLKQWYFYHKELWIEKEDTDPTHDRTWMSPDELYTMRKFIWLYKSYIKSMFKYNKYTKLSTWYEWINLIRDRRTIMSITEYGYWMELFEWTTDAWYQPPMSIQELSTINCQEFKYKMYK
jgi:hypothetical protein